MIRLISGFVAVAAGVGGAAMVVGPEQVSDALKLTPDDKTVLTMRIGGALVVMGAVVSLWRVVKG